MKIRVLPKFFISLFSILCLFFLMPSVSAEVVKTDLIIERDKIQTIISQSNLYLETSYNAFTSDLTSLGGIAYVDSVIADTLVEQTVVDTLTNDLIDLQNQLVTKLVHAAVNYDFQLARNRNLATYTLRSRTAFHSELDSIELILINPRSGDTVITALTTDIEDAADLLVLLADKTSLNQIMDQATAISVSDGTVYTPNSYNLFQNAYNAFDTSVLVKISMTVNEVYNNPDASVEEADAAVAAINEALALLIERADKSALIFLYNTATQNNVSDYTPNSVSAFNQGLDQIEAVIDDPNALQADITQAMADLTDYYSLLILKADVTTLSALNTQAMIAYYEEKNKYTDNSHNLFTQAVINYGTFTYVNSVVSDLNVTQLAVDQLSVTVQNALDLLVERGDVSGLLLAYNDLMAVDLSSYTPNSIASYQAELARINAIITSPNTDQTLVNVTLEEIITTSVLLIPLAELSVLISTINSVESVVETDYTVTSYGYLVAVLDTANIAINNPNISQNEVDQITDKLLQSIASLKSKLSPIIINAERGTVDINEFVVTGDSWITGYSSMNQSVAVVSPEGIVSGIDYGITTIIVQLANGLTEEIPLVVKAKIATSSFILVLSLPVISVGFAFGLLLSNSQSKLILRKTRKSKEI